MTKVDTSKLKTVEDYGIDTDLMEEYFIKSDFYKTLMAGRDKGITDQGLDLKEGLHLFKYLPPVTLTFKVAPFTGAVVVSVEGLS